MDFVDKVKGFLMEPSRTFDATKEEEFGEAVKYFAIIAAIYSVILALLFAFAVTFMGSMMGFRDLGMMMGTGAGIGGAIFTFISLMIFWILGAFIGGAILHIFVYIVGGRRGISQTIKAVMYGSTPSLLFGWIPFIGSIAWLWSLVLEIIGIQKLHEITTGRAILAVLIPLILAFILALVLAAMFAAFISGMGPTGRSF